METSRANLSFSLPLPLGRRSTSGQDERDIEDKAKPLARQKRSHKYIGPVYTYVKTDKHARYKWGVKHKVGKHHG